MDRQARKLAAHREEGSEGGSELGSNTDSDSDDKVRFKCSGCLWSCIFIIQLHVLQDNGLKQLTASLNSYFITNNLSG